MNPFKIAKSLEYYYQLYQSFLPPRFFKLLCILSSGISTVLPLMYKSLIHFLCGMRQGAVSLFYLYNQ